MALINCPECGKNVSDTIRTCIHCGYDLSQKKATTIEPPFMSLSPTTSSPSRENVEPVIHSTSNAREYPQNILSYKAIEYDKSELIGIKGWLLVANITIWLGLILNTVMLFRNLTNYVDRDVTRFVEEHVELVFIMYYETATSVIPVLLSVILIVFFMKKSRIFPKIYILSAIINFTLFALQDLCSSRKSITVYPWQEFKEIWPMP